VSPYIYISELDPETSEAELKRLLEKCGEVQSIFLVRRETHCYAFATMGSIREARNVVARLTGVLLGQRRIHVSYQKDKPSSVPPPQDRQPSPEKNGPNDSHRDHDSSHVGSRARGSSFAVDRDSEAPPRAPSGGHESPGDNIGERRSSHEARNGSHYIKPAGPSSLAERGQLRSKHVLDRVHAPRERDDRIAREGMLDGITMEAVPQGNSLESKEHCSLYVTSFPPQLDGTVRPRGLADARKTTLTQEGGDGLARH
jgi:RNA recognition motif-containing protein